MGKWKMVRLGDVLKYEQPTKYIVESTDYSDSYEIPVLTAGQSFILGYTNEINDIFNDLPVIIFDDFTTSTKFVDFPFKVKSSAMKILKLREKGNIKYLFYYINTIKTDTQLHKRYWISKYANIKIPLPPLEVQRQIADVLDCAGDLIEKRRAQIDKLDLLIKSQFVEMFGGIHYNKNYPYKTIKHLTKVVSGGTPNRSIESYWVNGTIPWVKTTELKNKELSYTEEMITKEGLDNSSAKLVPENTILIAMYGQGKTRGMTAYLTIESTTNQACACILPSKDINQKYLWHYLILSYDKLRSMAKGGNQPNLNSDMIKNFKVLVPPLDLQNQFADFVKQVEEQKTLLRQSLAKLELNYRSLMQKCFSGKVF